MIAVRLSNAQRSALECRDGGGLDPITERCWDKRSTITFDPSDVDELLSEIMEASNAEAECGDKRASWALTHLHSKIARRALAREKGGE